MSDRRHTQRPALPEGYQYGDAQPEVTPPFQYGDIIELPYDPMRYQLQDVCVSTDGSVHAARLVPVGLIPGGWRAPHENAAAQLRRRSVTTDTYLEAGRRLDAISAPFERVQRTGDEPV